MARKNRVFDGHSQLLGVDTFSEPTQVKYLYCSGAINKTFRGGIVRSRPSFKNKSLEFDTEENEQIFKKGNITGAINYDNTHDGRQPYVVVAVGDRILKGRVYANTIEFSLLYQGINPKRNSYFCQAEERLYWQNGEQDPVGWDGLGDAYEITGGIAADKMPIGTLMAFIQGRLVVLGEDNHLFVSDFIYGNGLTIDSSGVESFIEIQSFNDLGAIASPASLGPIKSLIPIPVTPDRNAQGDLLVICSKGAFTLNLKGQRSEWLASDILQVILTGVGSLSPNATVAANKDIWFRRADGGIGSLAFELSEQDKAWGVTAISREVEEYLAFDNPDMLSFCTSTIANNRMVMSTGFAYEESEIEGYGVHKFGRGMVALDFDKGSTINRRSGFSWEGLWTGVRPVAMFNVLEDSSQVPFVISYDMDGENRVYEFLSTRGDDVLDDAHVKIESEHETILLLDQQDARQEQLLKILSGIHAEVSEVYGKATLSFEFSPNHSEEWFEAGSVSVGADGLSQSTEQDGFNVVGPELKDFYDIVTVGIADDQAAEQGNMRVSTRARGYRVRLRITGKASIPLLQISANVTEDEFFSACSSEDEGVKYKDGVRVDGMDIFGYSIAKNV